jgi:hypothetical protein
MVVCWLAGWALAAETADPIVTVAPGRGLSVASDDGRFSIGLRARLQLRETVSAAAPSDGERDVTLQTQLYTARVWVAGNLLSPETSYVMQLAVGPRDFRDGAISPVYDAYVDFAQNSNVSFRVGQIFVPFDRLRTIREFALQMPDRPKVVSELTLDRDIGVYAYSDHLGGEGSPIAYRLGVFGGSGIHQLTAHPPGALFVGRVEVRPLGPIDDDSEGDLQRRDAAGLALGVGAAYNLGATRARSTTSTVFEGGTTSYLHLAGDVVFKARGFAWASEVVLRRASDDELVSVGDDGAEQVEFTRSGWGVVTQPSMMLSDRVDLVARYGRLAAFDGTDPTYLDEVAARANEVGLGSNVYLNGHRFKVQAGASAFVGDDAAPTDAELVGHVLMDVMF